MDDLLTTRQVQNILKVDRITIYRMLQDGRLKGVKIGQQWRFSTRMIQNYLSREAAQEIHDTPPAEGPHSNPNAFPAHCVQVIQDLYASMGKLGAVILAPDGAPLTEFSQPCGLCALLQASSAGQAACQNCWEAAVRQTIRPNGRAGFTQSKSTWHTCQAGLSFLTTPIVENRAAVAYVLSGPFYQSAPPASAAAAPIQQLSRKYKLSAEALLKAAQEVPVLNPQLQTDLEIWPDKFARAVEGILAERAGLVSKLQKIAEISAQ